MKTRICGLALAVLLAPLAARADEGMWLFTKPPLKTLEEKYKFTPDQKWLEHVRKSSVRFPSGSGSLVSADGLVMTNHHVALDSIQKLSSKEKDYVKTGFHAKSRDQELKAEGLELMQLQEISDVTDKVQAAVKEDMKPAEAAAARRAEIAKIEKEANEKTKLRCNVVTLYGGGQYHLYCYKVYDDVRLVFAPEQQIAFFGGDPDNFEYPRYDLDVTFFRVYEDNKPAKVDHHFKWSKYGATDNELVFVSGHPGRTSRMNTIAELEYLRDIGFPFLLQRLNRWEVLLSVYSERNEENRRQAKDFLFGVANSRKVRRGSLAGLLDPEFMKPKLAQEKKLRAFAAESKDEKLKEALKAWDKVAAAQKVRAGNIKRHTVLEQAAGFNSDLFAIARTLVRAAEEKPKPNPERLREFGDANLKALEVQLFSPEEIYPEYEAHKLADGLAFLCEVLGTKNPLVQKVLAGKSPQERAAQLVKGTTLAKVDERKKLYEGGKKAVDASKDPMILLAKMVDKDSRDVRKLIETQIDEVSRQAYAQIARVLYAMEGDKIYPDATFTLRLAFGAVKGYEENGKQVPFETTFAGLYEHSAEHGNKGVYELPERWLQRKDKLDLKVPFNFVLTADIIGGNSGSPVINKNAEIVGIIFDGNIHSLVSDFAYTEKQSRAVAVHSRGITEALAKVYDAKELVAELTENGKSAD